MLRGYVLLTCLYLLALLSISSTLAMRTASVMAQHARLLDAHTGSSLEIAGWLLRVEAALLRGESLAEPDVFETRAACDSQPGTWIRLTRLNSRQIHLVGGGNPPREARVIIYGLQICEGGRARLETSLAALRPASLPAGTSLPLELVLGRLSWREIW